MTFDRQDQIKKAHTEMFKMCEMYLNDCLHIVKDRRMDASFIDTLDKLKEYYKAIQNSKEKQ